MPKRRWQAPVAAGLVVPLFFTLSGSIYHQALSSYDSGGRLDSVPLPLSVILVWIGIVGSGRYMAAFPAAAFGAIYALLLAPSVIVVGASSAKVLMALQLLLPISGLALGLAINRDGLPKALAITTTSIIAWQFLVATVTYGVPVFTHDMLFFSIYQDRQYVPVIMVAAFSFAIFSIGGRWMRAGSFMVGVYAGMSMAALAMGLHLIVALFSRSKALVAIAVLSLATGVSLNQNQLLMAEKFGAALELRAPDNLTQRLRDWGLHSSGLLESPAAFFFGHYGPIDRSVSRSAHNYYLDVAYNFGAIATLPMITLSAYTLVLLWQRRRELTASDRGLALIILFFIFADNMLKVSLRQPYPGIFEFFLWGVLLNRFSVLTDDFSYQTTTAQQLSSGRESC